MRDATKKTILLAVAIGSLLVVPASPVLGTHDNTRDPGGDGLLFFRHRAEVLLDNPGDAVSDVPVKVTLNTSAMQSDGDLQDDCRDIRFTDLSGAKLDFWLESGCGTAATDFWVEVPDVPSGQSRILAHFQGPDVSDASDKNATFDDTALEVGTVDIGNTIDGGAFETVSLANTYDDPVVSAYIATRSGDQSVDVRVRNVTSDSFEVLLEEPDGDAAHNQETVGYVVAESGSFVSPNGALTIEAGSVSTDRVHRSPQAYNGTPVAFDTNFSSAPVVLATLNSHNNGDFMSTHVENVTADGFEVEQEAAGSGSPNATESVGWIAISAGSGTADGIDFVVDVAPEDGDLDGVNNTAEELSYSLGSAPALVAQSSTGNGPDGFWARGAGTYGADGATVFAEEDQVDDDERDHADEAFGFAAFAPEGTIALTVEHNISSIASPTRPLAVAMDPGADSVDVSWDEPTDEGDLPVDGYRIYRNGELLVSVGNTTTSFTDSDGLASGEDRTYAVSAFNAEGGEGAATEVGLDRASPPRDLRAASGFPHLVLSPGDGRICADGTFFGCPAPKNVCAAVVCVEPEPNDGEIEVTWRAPEDRGGGSYVAYEVFRSQDQDGPFQKVATTEPTVKNIRDSGLDVTETYHYKVRAVTTLGPGAFSDTACAAPGPWVQSLEPPTDTTCGTQLD